MDLFDLLGRKRAGEPAADAHAPVAIDLDALDEDNVPVTPTPHNEAWLQALHEVIDPEIGISIVDLGLVYAVELREARLEVVLTMTTPACPLSAVIEGQVREALLALDDVDEVRVAVVFEPAWNPSMMSETARKQLGG